MMNFIGSIGTIMKGSGLEEAFGIVNGTNSYPHHFGRSIFKGYGWALLGRNCINRLTTTPAIWRSKVIPQF